MVLLYDDWDRDPYPTPFGPIPHDLAVRLYYLDRPACWHFTGRGRRPTTSRLAATAVPGAPGAGFALIGRERDLPLLEQLGPVEVLAQGPTVKWDRTYLLARVQPGGEAAPPRGRSDPSLPRRAAVRPTAP